MTEPRQYDHALKELFSHPEMIESLIKTFIKADWIKHLEFSTLEPMKGEFITHTLQQ